MPASSIRFERAKTYVEGLEPPLVVKADGLAAGKGVVIAPDTVTAVRRLSPTVSSTGSSVTPGHRVLVEEYLEGPEVSILSLSDGKVDRPHGASQDHKRALDGDEGPNTGGMGAYSPVPLLDVATESEIHENVMEATVRAMEAEGIPYQGVLYGGLMLTDEGPKVLEFNVRFGDPETQAVLPRLSGRPGPAGSSRP